MPEPSREEVGLTPPTLTTASAGCGSSGSRTYSSDGVASSQTPIAMTSSTPTSESPTTRPMIAPESWPHGTAARVGPGPARAGARAWRPLRYSARFERLRGIDRRVAVTRGMRFLRECGVAFAEHRYEHRVKGAAYAAEALGLDAGDGREDARGAARRRLRVRARARRPRALAARPRARRGLALGGARIRARRPAPDRVPDRRHLAVRVEDRAAGVRRRGLARARARRAQRRRRAA